MTKEKTNTTSLIKEYLSELPGISVYASDFNKLLWRLVPKMSGTEYYDELFDAATIEFTEERMKIMTTNGYTLRTQSLKDLNDNRSSTIGDDKTIIVRGRQLSNFTRVIKTSGEETDTINISCDPKSVFLRGSSGVLVSVPGLGTPEWLGKFQEFRRDLRFSHNLLEINEDKLLEFARDLKSDSVITVRQESDQTSLIVSYDEQKELEVLSYGKLSEDMLFYPDELIDVLNRVRGTKIGFGIVQTSAKPSLPYIEATDPNDDFQCIMMHAIPKINP